MEMKKKETKKMETRKRKILQEKSVFRNNNNNNNYNNNNNNDNNNLYIERVTLNSSENNDKLVALPTLKILKLQKPVLKILFTIYISRKRGHPLLRVKTTIRQVKS